MKQFVRYQDHCEIGYGEIIEKYIQPLTGNFLDPRSTYSGVPILMGSVKLLAPVIPPNILAIGLNYQEHSEETKIPTTEKPLIFLKATSSLANPNDNIILPAIAPNEVDYEGELAIVIGKTAKNIAPAEVYDYVFGFTCANDVSARDCQLKIDKQWTRGKSFDTFAPVGPVVVQGLKANNLKIQTRLNGNIMQNADTSQLIFGIDELVSYCSHNMTLLPGTLILTGTPSGVGYSRVPPVFLQNGDVVEIDIENIGILRNKVLSE